MTRRQFIALGTGAVCAQLLPFQLPFRTMVEAHSENNAFDVVIIGGSYAGLAAGMALGRALRRVAIVDAGRPCNRQTPHSHNFITQDGEPPHLIAAKARAQVERYPTVSFLQGTATAAERQHHGFTVHMGGTVLQAKKLVFATGIRDLLPAVPGLAECWGISVLHCPYCHGYEVRGEPTGVLGNGEKGFELARLLSNWTRDLTLFTNGPSTLSTEQAAALQRHGIAVEQSPVRTLVHERGHIQRIHYGADASRALTALYATPGFEQHSPLPEQLGCALTEEGYLQVDAQQRTTAPGIYACGDNTTRIRTVANAVATGTTAGMMLNKELVAEAF